MWDIAEGLFTASVIGIVVCYLILLGDRHDRRRPDKDTTGS